MLVTVTQCFSKMWAFRKRVLWLLIFWHQDMVQFIQVLSYIQFFLIMFLYGVCSEDLCLQYRERAGLKASFRKQNTWVLASLYITADRWCKISTCPPLWLQGKCWALALVFQLEKITGFSRAGLISGTLTPETHISEMESHQGSKVEYP
jgi:hypothetical protein